MQNKGKQSILEKIKRPVDPKLFIKEIDGLRFLAILTVFMLHLNNYVSRTGLSTGSGSGSRSFLPSAVS